jgi:hypothetical protein
MMLQTLDLARENARLKSEVSRLRGEIERLARAYERSLPREQPGTRVKEAAAQTSSPAGESCAPLTLVVPRSRTGDYQPLADRFADVPSCAVIVDRRTVERRRQQAKPAVERRRVDRRGSDAVVVSGGSSHAV